MSADGLAWDFAQADVAIDTICGIADPSGGGLVEPADVHNADDAPAVAAASGQRPPRSTR